MRGVVGTMVTFERYTYLSLQFSRVELLLFLDLGLLDLDRRCDITNKRTAIVLAHVQRKGCVKGCGLLKFNPFTLIGSVLWRWVLVAVVCSLVELT